MSILRRRTFIRKADDTRQDVSDAAASGNISSPNQPWTRKAKADPRIEWFKRNPDKLKGYFVNAGGLVGFVVGTGKVGNTNMIGLKIRDAHGKVDVADLSSLKSVSSDPDLDRKAGVPTQEVESKEKAARPAMRKGDTGDSVFDALFEKYWAKDYWGWEEQADDENIKAREGEKIKRMVDKVRAELTSGEVSERTEDLIRSTQKFTREYLAKKDGAPATGGGDAVMEFYANKYTWDHRDDGTAKAAVIDPKIALSGTPFDAQARIINKTNGRLLKSKEFKGRFAKASARAWADAEVKKLL